MPVVHTHGMSAGLSLSDQIAQFRKSGIEPQVGSVWSGRLEEWLSAVLPPGAAEHYGAIRHDEEEPGDGPPYGETVVEWTDAVVPG